GQGEKDLREIEQKAKSLGARKTYSIDCREEFVQHYINPAIRANALYESKYPVATAIARPLIGKHLARTAEKEKADAVSHGSTGKGNDQVRFELAVRALNPDLKIIAPAREWDLTRDKAIEFAKKEGIPIPVDVNSPYSTDENLWGRSVEAGPLEDPMHQPSEDVYKWTASPEKAPDKPEYVKIGFEHGVPVSLDAQEMDEVKLIQKLNGLGGKHGIGRIDMIEDRLVGIKSREIYECPAATIVLEAHKDLERLTLTREEVIFKETVDSRWAQLAYFGQWYEPLMHDLNSFIAKTQESVSGTVRMKLYKGSATVVGRESENSLYDLGLATYDKADKFDHKLAEGFVRLWGLPSEIASRRKR
ncbi:MAG: argininosuccinate synthase, partial [Candidatus Altiarchaeota archaeon]|nr:argininosuccinate synthase [Candidatus Altiarchaeota archaeon]